jgi:acyl carrier protein
VNQSQIMAQFTELVGDVLRRGDLVLTTDMAVSDVPGWDSFTHMEIVIAVEEHFQLSLRTSEIVALRRVEDWVSLLTRHESSLIGADPEEMT